MNIAEILKDCPKGMSIYLEQLINPNNNGK